MEDELHHKRVEQLKREICNCNDAIKRKNSDIECYQSDIIKLKLLIQELLDNGSFFTSAIEAENPWAGLNFQTWETKAKELMFILNNN